MVEERDTDGAESRGFQRHARMPQTPNPTITITGRLPTQWSRCSPGTFGNLKKRRGLKKRGKKRVGRISLLRARAWREGGRNQEHVEKRSTNNCVTQGQVLAAEFIHTSHPDSKAYRGFETTYQEKSDVTPTRRSWRSRV